MIDALYSRIMMAALRSLGPNGYLVLASLLYVLSIFALLARLPKPDCLSPVERSSVWPSAGRAPPVAVCRSSV